MSETPCEWLDGLLNGDYDFTVYSRKNARAELAQLRADLQVAQERIAQLEAAQAFGDAEIEQYWQQTAEQERSNAAEQRERAEQLRATVAEQARKLAEARNLIIRSGRVINNLKKPESVYDLTSDLLDWLAANPAPQESQTPNGEGRP